MRIILILAMLALISCEKTERGPELTEPAIVEDSIYQTDQHGTGLGYAFTGGKSGGGIVMTSVSIPAKWAIVFHCQHGKFIVEGEREKHRLLWQKLSKGDQVMVHYKEIYALRKEGRVLTGFDFIDATK